MATGLFSLLMLGLTAGAAWAEVAARADFINGLVTATAGGQPARGLLKGSEILGDDQIDTAEGGRAQLRFSDGGLVSLLPNTTFSVEEYRLGEAGGEEGSLVFGLLRGGLRTVTGAIGKSRPDNYQLRTPMGTLGIRGTEYIAVIGPPGTLRVHVGRGKVVITNAYGFVEVAEGHNAIVVEGQGPRLTEDGPLYMATGPQGDLKAPRGMVRADPYGLDLPLPLFRTFLPGQQFLASGPGYFMTAIQMRPITGIPDTFAGWPGYAAFDTSSGALTSFTGAGGSIDLSGTGAATALSQSTVADLNWGALSNGSVTLQGVPRIFASGDSDPGMRYLPYIIGQGATAPLTGLLSYTLPSGVTPPAFANTGDIGTLTQFDLGINIASLTYTLDMSLTMPGTVYSAAGATGTVSYSGVAPQFSFFNTTGFSQGGAPCACALNASGFVTTGGNAGVAYSLHDNTTVITGVAPLVPPGWTPPAPSPGTGTGSI